MANPELEQLANGLREVNVEATELIPKLSAAERAMQELLTTATSGKAAPQAIQETSTQLLAGTMPVTESLNIGGVGVDLNEFGPRIKQFVAEFQKTIIDRALLTLNDAKSLVAKAGEVQTDLSGAVSKGTVKTKAAATSTPDTITKAENISLSDTVNTTKVIIADLATAIAKYTRTIEANQAIEKVVGFDTDEAPYEITKRRGTIKYGVEGVTESDRTVYMQPEEAEKVITAKSHTGNINATLDEESKQLLLRIEEKALSGITTTKQRAALYEEEPATGLIPVELKHGYATVGTAITDLTVALVKLEAAAVETSQALETVTRVEEVKPTEPIKLSGGSILSPEEISERENLLYTTPLSQLPPSIQKALSYSASSKIEPIREGTVRLEDIPGNVQNKIRVSTNTEEYSNIYEEGYRHKDTLLNALQNLSDLKESKRGKGVYASIARGMAMGDVLGGNMEMPPNPELLLYLGEGDEAARAYGQGVERFETYSASENPEVEDWLKNRWKELSTSSEIGVEPPTAQPIPENIFPELEAKAREAVVSINELSKSIDTLGTSASKTTEPTTKVGETLERVAVEETPIQAPIAKTEPVIRVATDQVDKTKLQELADANIGKSQKELIDIYFAEQRAAAPPTPPIPPKPPVTEDEFDGVEWDYSSVQIKLQEILKKRFSAIFAQLSPEQINKMVDAALVGEDRISAGTVDGKRFRPRLTEVYKEVEGDIAEIHSKPPTLPGLEPDMEAWRAKINPELAKLYESLNAKRGGAVSEDFEGIIEAYEEALGSDLSLSGLYDSLQLSKQAHAKYLASLSDDYEEAAARLGSVTDTTPEPGLQPTDITAGTPTPESNKPPVKLAKRAVLPETLYEKFLPSEGLTPAQINNINDPIMNPGVKQLIRDLGLSFDSLVPSMKTVNSVTKELTLTFYKEGEELKGKKTTLRITPDAVSFANRPLDIDALQKEEQLKRAFALAEKQGFRPSDLQSITKFPKYQKMLFERESPELPGVTEKLPLHVDEAGKALISTQKQFRGTVDAIVRDYKEVLRWSVAVAAIYGPMRKLSEAIQLAIENETKLARIGIVLNKGQEEMASVFESAAKAARLMGVDIGGVLESYELAYKAAGRTSSEMERTAVANSLLTNTLILSKLSSLEQAQALDILAGTLQQVGSSLDGSVNPLTNGLLLLDKWVAVSKTANVDLGTLATAFSITAESAANAGLDIDKLNGVVAALSEKIGALGAAQTGNAVRALIGGVYTPGAEEALGKYGIGIKNSSDQMRDWLDIMTEVYELNQKGLISDDQLNKLALTLGQGVRRGQQYLSVLSDMDRVSELAEVSANAHGDAEEALALSLDTVNTATTNLSTAFQQFARALGTEGGILSTVRLMLDLTTKLTDGLTSLLGVLGKAGPALAIAGAAYMMFFKDGGLGRLQTNIANTLYTGSFLERADQKTKKTIFTSAGQEVVSDKSRYTALENTIRYLPGIATGIPSAFSYLGGEDGAGKAGTVMGAAILGTLMAGGNPLGGLIGTVIADTFINGLTKAKGEISDALVIPFKEEAVKYWETGRKITPEEEGLTQDQLTRKQEIEMELESLMFSSGIDKFRAQFDAWAENLLNRGAIKEGEEIQDVDIIRAQAELTVKRYEAGEKVGRIGPFKTEGSEIAGRQFETGEEAYEWAKKIVDAYAELESITPVKLVDVDVEESSLAKIKNSIADTFQPEIKAIQEDLRELFKEDLFEGAVKPKQFADIMEIISGFPSALPKLAAPLFWEEGQSPEEQEKALRNLAKTLTGISSEEYQIILKGAEDIYKITAEIEAAEKASQTTIEWQIGAELEVINLEEAKQILFSLNEDYGNNLQAIVRESMKRAVQLPTIVGAENITTQDQLNMVMERAKELEYAPYQEGIDLKLEGFTPEAIQALIDDAEPFLVKAGEKMGYLMAQGLIDTKYFTEAINELMDEGLLTSQKLGYQFLDFTQAEVQGVMPEYDALKKRIEEAGGTVEEQDQLNIYKDGIIEPMRKDWKLVQYLLQQIADNTKKQLDGMYNFPEGASFWIPLSAAQMYSQRTTGGAGGTGAGGGETEETKTLPPTPYAETQQRAWIEKLNTQRPLAPATVAEVNEINKVFIPTMGYTAPEVEETTSWLDNLKTGTENFVRDLGSIDWTSVRTLNELPAIMELIKDWAERIFPNFNQTGDPTGISLPPISDSNITTAIPANTASIDTNSAIGLKLSIESRTQLVVDGRTMANVVKNYIRNDLIRSSGTASSLNLNAVI